MNSPATGLGFNTTKGSLVRSMLFPKPMGFKFYRDSIRFIGVLACMAGVGFCASAIQFIRLGVR
jgi:cation-transporting ATPase 13A2